MSISTTQLNTSTHTEQTTCPCCGQKVREPLLLDTRKFTVTRGNQTIQLIGQEFDIFYLLWTKRHRPVSRDELVLDLYGMQNDIPKKAHHVIYARMYTLRKRLALIRVNIVTVYNRGYVVELL